MLQNCEVWVFGSSKSNHPETIVNSCANLTICRETSRCN